MTLCRNSTEEQNSEKIQTLWGQLPRVRALTIDELGHALQ